MCVHGEGNGEQQHAGYMCNAVQITAISVHTERSEGRFLSPGLNWETRPDLRKIAAHISDVPKIIRRASDDWAPSKAWPEDMLWI